jgi:hypothetical protein
MKVAQQIVGVNQRLGNTAVPNMQGTTRCIFDTGPALTASTDQTVTYFSGVSSRLYPLSNISINRFEVGESLAVQGIAFFLRPTTLTNASNLGNDLVGAAAASNTLILNFYIGNQRVIKDLDLNYGSFMVGETYKGNDGAPTIIRLETPIVIPPQIEFYATLRIQTSANTLTTNRPILALYGQGTLLNTKSSF